MTPTQLLGWSIILPGYLCLILVYYIGIVLCLLASAGMTGLFYIKKFFEPNAPKRQG